MTSSIYNGGKVWKMVIQNQKVTWATSMKKVLEVNSDSLTFEGTLSEIWLFCRINVERAVEWKKENI